MRDSWKGFGSDRYDFDTLRQIVRDASEAQQHRLDTLSRKDVEEIAAELGIDRRDLELAFQAHAASTERETPTSFLKQWITRIAVGTSGAIAALGLHALDRFVGQPYFGYTVLATLIALLCAETTMTWSLKGKTKHVVFQSVNLTLWAGWSAICFFVIDHPEGGLPGIFLCGATAVLGSVLLLARERSTRSAPISEIPATAFTTSDRAEKSARDNVVERIRLALSAQPRLPRVV